MIDYICAYGFCIDIPPDRLWQANAIVSTPGSYYALGRIGTIVVSPKEKLVLYFYNGEGLGNTYRFLCAPSRLGPGDQERLRRHAAG